jgi:endoglucanase
MSIESLQLRLTLLLTALSSTAVATELQYTVANQWNTGFQANTKIINDTSSAINNWRLEFDYPYAITQIWNASIQSRVGNRLTLSGLSWNQNIAARGSVEFGFVGASGNATVRPSNCRLNGQAFTVGFCAGNSTANQAPVALANGPYSGSVGGAIAFRSTGSNDPDGSITNYAWSFGDGASSSVANPSHSYASAGNYTVRLTVTDNRGASNSASTTAAITNGGGGGGSGATPVEKNGQLKVCGNRLCNKNNKAIQLRGVSGHGPQWFPSCYSDAAIANTASTMGADLFRIAMYVNEGGYDTDPAGFRSKVDNYVDAVSRNGMYAMIDWHILERGDPNEMRNIALAREFFEYMSRKHNARNNVIYEIANEPNGESVNWPRIKLYADQIIPIIRANDPDAVIIVGTPRWSSLGLSGAPAPGMAISDIVNNKISDANTMYAFHFYAASHQDYHRDNLALAADQLPIFVTEFGTTSFDGNGALDLVSTDKYMTLMAQKKISWAVWSYSDDFRSSSVLKQNTCTGNGPWNASSLTPNGTYISDKMRNPVDDF